MTFAVCFTNFGPYHLARLRALAAQLARARRPVDRLRGRRQRADCIPGAEPRRRAVRVDHALSRPCARNDHRGRLPPGDARQPSTVIGPTPWASSATPGPSRWPPRGGLAVEDGPAILMSESQEIDRPESGGRSWSSDSGSAGSTRPWWAARPIANIWCSSGCPPGRIALGYNAVDNDFSRVGPRLLARSPAAGGFAHGSYFLAVSRFVPEKNLVRLIGRSPVTASQTRPEHSLGPGSLRWRP